MNHLKYLDMLTESSAYKIAAEFAPRWAIVRNVPHHDKKYYGRQGNDIYFEIGMKKFIGQRLRLYPSSTYSGLWKDDDNNWYYHPDWLRFDDEDQQINLFTADPK
jgi:hypothetical protein